MVLDGRPTRKLLAFCVAALALGGCNAAPDQQLRPQAHPQTTQDRVMAIQNDPHIPPDAKARAMAAFGATYKPLEARARTGN